MLFRTHAQKEDLAGSWRRFDRAFFASGACHVLAHQFLQRSRMSKFRPYMVIPEPGFRGSHVFVSDGALVFDYHGWSRHAHFVDHYLRKIRRIFPGWRGAVADISCDFWTQSWFERTWSRQPHDYFVDPTERANSFVDRYINRMPNQALEPTTTAVTHPADAGCAPAVVVAHL